MWSPMERLAFYSVPNICDLNAWRLEGIEQLLVAPMRHSFQQAVFLENVFPYKRTVGFRVKSLTVTVRGLLQGLSQLQYPPLKGP